MKSEQNSAFISLQYSEMFVWYTETTEKLLEYGPPYTEVDFCEIMLRSHAHAFLK